MVTLLEELRNSDDVMWHSGLKWIRRSIQESGGRFQKYQWGDPSSLKLIELKFGQICTLLMFKNLVLFDANPAH